MITVLDSTLREDEQTAGVCFSLDANDEDMVSRLPAIVKDLHEKGGMFPVGDFPVVEPRS
jgi:isopropylmalate/homocitrate/citramalate synthase